MSSDFIDIELVPEHRQTLDTLKALSGELQVKAIRSSLKVAGKPLVGAMKAKVPKRTGHLASTINQTQVKAGDPVYATAPDGFKKGRVRLADGEVGVIVGPNKYAARFAFIGTILEHGANPHRIGTQYGSLRIGGNFVGSEVSHPGFKGKKWIAPSLELVSDQIEGRFYEGLTRHVNKYI